MSTIFIKGLGAVSPAGWGIRDLCNAVKQQKRPELQELTVPGMNQLLKGLRVPHVVPRPSFAAHARLRRTSPIAQYAVGAALEALGADWPGPNIGSPRFGVVYCSMAGCVNFSRRFYDETLKDPSTASPVIFPETVFNAPASHLGALLGTSGPNYTMVGDPGTFLQGLGLAADWLSSGRVDKCLVIGAEELDYLVAHAADLFDSQTVISEGAGALYLSRESSPGAVALEAITDSNIFFNRRDRATAATTTRAQLALDPAGSVLCDSIQAVRRLDHAEASAWNDWTGDRLSPKKCFGEAFMAAAAWQCVVAVDTLLQGEYLRAGVNVVGCNQQAIAALFARS